MLRNLGLILIVCIILSCEKEQKSIALSGQVFGTTFSILYHSNTNYEKEFDSLYVVINKSLSTYLPNSDISKVNRNEQVNIDSHFIKVFESSKQIYLETDGVFDPTIGAVVNAWDFGPEGRIIDLDSSKIDSLMSSVGFDKVRRDGNSLVKPTRTYLDFNAIAKGYAVDVIAEFLDSKLVKNYLVEIGGEIRSKGENVERQSAWRIGIDTPNFEGEQYVMKAISIQDEAMATSGTYRKFKVDENGNRYAHIIDTKTGYPSKSNILSVSVITETCMIADAYATAFQAMQLDQVIDFLEDHKALKVFIVFENESKELETLRINGFPEN